MPLDEILRAATIDNATAFHHADRGSIGVGKCADLVLLDADPLKSADAYDAIDTVARRADLDQHYFENLGCRGRSHSATSLIL